MVPLQFLVPVSGLEAVSGALPAVVLVLAFANVGTRYLAHQHHEQAATTDDETLERYRPHLVTSALLVLGSFAFLVVEPHGGMVLSVLAVGTVVADFFEFEARAVEVRNDLPLERPNSALVASALVVGYAAYQSLFVFVEPFWSAIV